MQIPTGTNNTGFCPIYPLARTEWLDNLDAEDVPITPLADFQQMRKANYEVYELFCDAFVSCVTGRYKYKKNILKTRMTHVATVSDEAFAHLLVENSYDRWVDIHNNKDQASVPTGKRKRWESNKPPKYTFGGLQSVDGSRRYKGWTDEGINRYNELFQKVARDRRKRPSFATQYLAQKMAENTKARSKQAEDDEDEKATPTRAKHELWDTITGSDNEDKNDDNSQSTETGDDDDDENNDK